MERSDMESTGPQLTALLHRLAECPPEFLLPPDEINVFSLVCDHFRILAQPIPQSIESQWVEWLSSEHRRFVAVALWLLRDDWFLARGELALATGMMLLSDPLARLARLVQAEWLVNDPDRREEFIRLCLQGMHLRPEGESPAQAADRLNTLDSVERDRVIRQTRQHEARAREIREAMARKAAQEAATRYSPE